MIIFPNCKINLGLNILSKRNDGYHELQTVFYPLPFYDVLEVIQNDKSGGEPEFSLSGIETQIRTEDNLCYKAFQLLKKDFPGLPTFKMHLLKTIPLGAGLGGGSSDAAFTLRLLNQKFDLGLSTEKLIDYALQLGSDCPFFIINKPCYATGRGEFLETIPLDLSSYKFILVNPQIHINTSEAFKHIKPEKKSKSVKEIIQQPVESWEEELKNDFEVIIFKQYPEIKTIKEDLYDSGAVYSSMSGSGSTVYGIFKNEDEIATNFPENFFVKILPGKL